MSILHFRKKKEPVVAPTTPKQSQAASQPAVSPVERSKPAKKTDAKALRGASLNAYRVLLKPLVTEKAADLSAHNQYVFMIDPRMNKIEVKKAVRTIYGVDPISVNVSVKQGKSVRYGRTYGVTKSWKKAIVTLKAGDKIEVYEGV